MFVTLKVLIRLVRDFIVLLLFLFDLAADIITRHLLIKSSNLSAYRVIFG